MRILLVEDDDALAAAVTEALSRQGFSVDRLAVGGPAEAALTSTGHDLLLLDIGLPDISGFELLRRVRDRGLSVPVLMLTARDAVEDRVQGLRQGADDYLVKPFALAELIARCEALLRRTRSASSSQLGFDALRLDLGLKQARLDDTLLDLTAREWSLLMELCLAAPNVVDKARLTDSLGRWDREISANAIEIAVSRLRSKLGAGPVEIRTVRGMGYRLARVDA